MSNTPQLKHHFLNHNLKVSHCCVLGCLCQSTHGELFKVLFFLWGSRASYMPYHQIDVTYSTCYHGEEPLHALLMLHFFTCFSTLKARTLYSSIRAKHEAHSLQHHFCLFLPLYSLFLILGCGRLPYMWLLVGAIMT